MNSKNVLMCVVLLGASTISVQAQTYAVDRYTIEGGGGTSAGGVYSVTGQGQIRTLSKSHLLM